MIETRLVLYESIILGSMSFRMEPAMGFAFWGSGDVKGGRSPILST